MIRHIVMFDFKKENKKENIQKAKEMLENKYYPYTKINGSWSKFLIRR